MNKSARQVLLVGLTFVGGLYFFLEYVLPEKIGEFKFGAYHEQILRGLTVMGAMAFGLGLINIVRVHGSRLAHRGKGWVSSFALLFGMTLMFVVQGGDYVASQSALNSWKPTRDLVPYLAHIGTLPFAEAKPKVSLLVSTLERQKAELLDPVLLVDRYERERTTSGLPSPRDIPNYQRQRSIDDFEKKFEIASLSGKKLAAAYNTDSASENERLAARTEMDASLKQLLPSFQELARIPFEDTWVHKTSSLLYNGFFVPLASSMFALLAFYIAHAAYRSFRLKSMEAVVMMTTAIVVILGQISYGPLYISEHLPAVRLWLMQNVNTPGNRAIYFGAAVGGLAMAVRMWLSLEKNPLETEESPR